MKRKTKRFVESHQKQVSASAWSLLLSLMSLAQLYRNILLHSCNPWTLMETISLHCYTWTISRTSRWSLYNLRCICFKSCKLCLSLFLFRGMLVSPGCPVSSCLKFQCLFTAGRSPPWCSSSACVGPSQWPPGTPHIIRPLSMSTIILFFP